jgi:hypothetical protein
MRHIPQALLTLRRISTCALEKSRSVCELRCAAPGALIRKKKKKLLTISGLGCLRYSVAPNPQIYCTCFKTLYQSQLLNAVRKEGKPCSRHDVWSRSSLVKYVHNQFQTVQISPDRSGVRSCVLECVLRPDTVRLGLVLLHRDLRVIVTLRKIRQVLFQNLISICCIST